MFADVAASSLWLDSGRTVATKIGNALSERKRAFPPTSLAKIKTVSNPIEATRVAAFRYRTGD
jgi:hypothetical protein